MAEIILTQNKVAIVDDSDFESLRQFSWQLGNGYAVRTSSTPHRRTIRMHRQIMNPPEGLVVDHINGNKLDNQRSNLRICTHAENTRNQRRQTNNTSGFKGVTFNKQRLRWVAKIKVAGRYVWLGYFDSPIAAARAYDAAARRYHGAFACVNEVPNGQD